MKPWCVAIEMKAFGQYLHVLFALFVILSIFFSIFVRIEQVEKTLRILGSSLPAYTSVYFIANISFDITCERSSCL